MNQILKILNTKRSTIISSTRSLVRRSFIHIPHARGHAFVRRRPKPVTICPAFLLASINFMGLLSVPTPNGREATRKSEADAQAHIVQMIEKARTMLKNKDYAGVKSQLYDTLRLVETTKDYQHLTEIYDMLLITAMQSGNIAEAEEMLVRFIDKLIQIGHKDTHDLIVRYKLRLARLYQTVGNTDMAEIGYMSCVRTQEEKIRQGCRDAETTKLYLRSIFWYARFLTDGSDLEKAEKYMCKAVEFERANHVLDSGEFMGFLFHTAEIEFKLQKYSESLLYLTQCLEVCFLDDAEKSNLPVYLVKMGIVCLHLKLYDDSRYWCTKGLHFAKVFGNADAEREANDCLRSLESKSKT